jgi:hypothetical protein
MTDGVIICYTRCWSCQYGEHYAPPQWHTWADQEDVDHAKATGQSDPSESRCGCPCADVPDSAARPVPAGGAREATP